MIVTTTAEMATQAYYTYPLSVRANSPVSIFSIVPAFLVLGRTDRTTLHRETHGPGSNYPGARTLPPKNVVLSPPKVIKFGLSSSSHLRAR